MKILMTCENFMPRIGGAEIHVKNLATRLVEKGHDVVLVTNEPRGNYEDSKENFEVIRIEWNVRNIYKLFYTLWLQGTQSDVIHSHYSYRMAMLCSIIGFLKHKKVFVTLHGLGILDPVGTSWRGKTLHSLYRYTSLKLSSHIISTSNDLAGFAYRFVDKSKVTVISNAYDERVFVTGSSLQNKQHIHEKQNYEIATLRRLVPKNGVQYLLEAFPLIKKSLPSARLNIIGDGPLMEALQRRADILGIKSAINFLGFKNANEVASILKSMDVVVFPSTAESASLACIEVMAMEVPIVASRVGGLIELLGENSERGTLVSIMPWTESNYNSPEILGENELNLLAEAVIDSINKNEISKRKAKEAANYVRINLSWDVATDKIIKVYEQ